MQKIGTLKTGYLERVWSLNTGQLLTGLTLKPCLSKVSLYLVDDSEILTKCGIVKQYTPVEL